MDTDEFSVDEARRNVVGLPVDVRHCSSLDFILISSIDSLLDLPGIGELRDAGRWCTSVM